jgi:hypothetical protein
MDSTVEHSSSSDQTKWCSTNFEEISLFLATFMLMAHIKKFRIKDYWSTDPLVATPIFSDIMPIDRFLLLLKFLHFTSINQSEDDRLYKIKPVVKYLKEKSKQIMTPYRNLCVDESLMLWKGRLSFKQYIPSKRRRFGIKIFILCDCILRHVPIPKPTPKLLGFEFGVLGTALGIGYWVLGQFWVWVFWVLGQLWVWVFWVLDQFRVWFWGFGFCSSLDYDDYFYKKSSTVC